MRCFLAIELPDEIKEKVYALEKELPKTGTKPVAKENLHITLKFLGDVKENRVKEALLSLSHPKIPLLIKGVGAFPSMNFVRVVWVGVYGELKPLVRKIEDALSLPHEDFVGHVTIARMKRKVDMEEFFSKHKNEIFGEFVAKSFALFQSILTHAGPVYKKLWEKTLL